MPRFFSLALVFVFCARLSAQTLSVEPQNLALFPSTVGNLSMVDGELYAYTQGLCLHLPRISGSVTAAVGDTLWRGLDPNLSYLVRNPRTGNIFFQTTTKNGSTLYEQIPRIGKSPKIVKVKLPDAKNITIEHPVFTQDGLIMVFATPKRIGLGGSDLWYSEYDTVSNEWGRPVNLGNRINSPGDEASPAFVDEFLLFASRNRMPGDSVWSLYATPFRAETANADTARRNTIGLAPVQKLPAPINSSADDYEILPDPSSNTLYLLSRRKGNDALYRCVDALSSAWLHGRVSTKEGRPLPNTIVRCSDANGASIETVTDALGNYQMLLIEGRSYRFDFVADTCFNQSAEISVKSTKDFIAQITHNVALDRMPMNEPIRYDNLFAHASGDFTSSGVVQMRRLGQFLEMNPDVKVSFSVSSAAYDDMLLDKMLSDARIQTLKAFFNLDESRIDCTNSTYAQSRQPNAKESEIEVRLHLD